jgi:FkbM family methyltransferase
MSMRRRLRRGLHAIVTWPPLNRIVTGALHAALPERVRRRPALARFLPRTGLVEATLPGGGVLRMSSRGDDDVASELFWRGWSAHEPETTEVFYELAGSARVVLDVGAHVGYFALLAAHANPRASVYAFEPMPRVRARLEHNIALNASTVSCEPFALGGAPGSAEFFHTRNGIPSSSSLAEGFMRSIVEDGELTSSTVEVLTGDDFVQSRALEGVDLVKIDTETTEAAVLAGLLGTLRRDRPHIVCEVLDGDVATDIEALLEPLGYEFFGLTASGPVRRERIRPDPRWRNFLFRPAPRA